MTMQNIDEYLSTKIKISNKDKYCIVYPHNDAWEEFCEHQHDDVQFFTLGSGISLFLFTKAEALELLDKYSSNDVWLFEVTEDFDDVDEYIKKINRKLPLKGLKQIKTE